MHISGLFAICLSLFAVGHGQQTSDPLSNKELQAIRNIDQADRKIYEKGFPSKEQLEWIDKRDHARLQRVFQMLQNDEIKTGEDFDNAGLIYQHGFKPEHYLIARALGIVANMKGRHTSLPATAHDRFLKSIGRKQRFGTQFSPGPDNTYILDPIDEGHDSDVTDGMRMDALYPPLAVTKEKGLQAQSAYIEKIFARAKKRWDPKWQEEMAPKRYSRSPDLNTLEKASPERQREMVLKALHDDRFIWGRDYSLAAAYVGDATVRDALLSSELAMIAAMWDDRGSGILFGRRWDEYCRQSNLDRKYWTSGLPKGLRKHFQYSIRAKFNGRNYITLNIQGLTLFSPRVHVAT